MTSMHPSASRLVSPSRRRISRDLLPTLVVLAASLVYLVCRPASIDMAAAQYRAALFGHTGFAIWDLQWYGGHYLPAYSVLVPALSWLVGPPWLGVLAVVAATAFLQRLVVPQDPRSLAAVTLFGLGVLASLVSGRVTFTAGVPVAVAALLVGERSARRTSLAVAGALALSAATALFSPVASLFLAVVWTALLLARRRWFYLGALAATFAPIVALNLAFAEIGVEPLSLGAITPVAVFTAVMVVWRRRRCDRVTVGLVVYLVSCLVTWWIRSPVGANVLRLGPLGAAPLALLTLPPGRRPMLIAFVAALCAWQWCDAVGDVREASGNPSVDAAYYRPLLGELDRLSGSAGEASGNGFRVEIAFTQLHWEARWVAPRYALARGWERQVDMADNPLFYRRGLTAATYDRWLHANAVRYVALPRTTLDRSARAERRIILSRPGFLIPIWHSRDWQLDAVRNARPLLSRPGRLRSVGSDSITFVAPAHSRELLRVRWNPYWAVTAGSGCVSPAGPWLQVQDRSGGEIELGERFSLSRIDADSPRCSG